MGWFGSEIPALQPLPSCPYSQLPPAEQGSLGSIGICMEQLIICLRLCAETNSVLQRLEQGGDTPRWGLELLCSILGSQGGEKSGERREGSWGNLSSLHSAHVKCLKSWTCVSSNQPMASTMLPPDLVQNLPLEEFVWNCFPWEQEFLLQNVYESWGAHGGGMSVRGEQDLKDCG